MSNSVTAAIDSMVNQTASAGNVAISTQTTSNMKLDNDGTVSMMGAPVAQASLDVPAQYDAAAEVRVLTSEISRISAELAEGNFDSKGQRIGDKITGRDRDVRTTQWLHSKVPSTSLWHGGSL